MGPPTTIEELRDWHLNKAETARKVAEKFETGSVEWEYHHPGFQARYGRNKAKANRGIEHWHLKAVDVLNRALENKNVEVQDQRS